MNLAEILISIQALKTTDIFKKGEVYGGNG